MCKNVAPPYDPAPISPVLDVASSDEATEDALLAWLDKKQGSRAELEALVRRVMLRYLRDEVERLKSAAVPPPF